MRTKAFRERAHEAFWRNAFGKAIVRREDNEEICSKNKVYVDYEDLYFADLIPSLWCGFKKPNYKVAAKFAFDRNPDLALQINNMFPDGIHWFDKYAKYYKELGIDIPDSIIEYTDKN